MIAISCDCERTISRGEVADERVVLTTQVVEAEVDGAEVMCAHVGEEPDVGVVESLLARLRDRPADHSGDEAQRRAEGDDPAPPGKLTGASPASPRGATSRSDGQTSVPSAAISSAQNCSVRRCSSSNAMCSSYAPALARAAAEIDGDRELEVLGELGA